MEDYKIVTYKDEKYVVVAMTKKTGDKVPYVIDYDDMEEVLKSKWACTGSRGNNLGYVASSSMTSYTLLHRYVMEITDKNITVDHVNRIKLDNRKENLRIATVTEQIKNRKMPRQKNKILSKAGIEMDKIPMFISFDSNRNSFRIAVSGRKFSWSGTNSEEVSLKYKLEEAKKYLRELLDSNPELFKGRMITEKQQKRNIKLAKGWNKILRRSGYNFIDNYLVDLDDYDVRQYLEENLEDLTKKEKKLLKNVDFDRKGRRLISNLPKNCGVKTSDLPKFCYYHPEDKTSSDYFYISQNHPKLIEHNKKSFYTTKSKMVTTKEKFDQLMKEFKKIEKS
jgi:hypothetical protein